MLRLPIYILTLISLFFIGCKGGSKSGQLAKNITPGNDTSIVENSFKKANYNVYIENSGSMNGYVCIGSDFKNAVLGLITDLKSKNITDTLSIYYVNKQICPKQINALPQEIEYFFKNLNPTSFSNSGCGTNTSFMPEIIKKAVTTNPNTVNILVSDFIFSDSLGSSPQYLESARYTVKLYLADELKQRDFSTIVLKLNSQFEGYYYVESKRPLKIDLKNKNIRRPYYIMIFGNQEKLQLFLSKIKFNDYKGFENSYSLLTPANIKPNAKLIRTNRIGDFEIEQPSTKLVINNAKAGGRNADQNTFQFSIAANLEFLKIDDSYLSSPANYDISSNYTITSILPNTDETNESLKGFTHIFTISTFDLKLMQDVSIQLKSKLPNWVTESSTIDDSNPFDSLKQHQTFGFDYLIRGLSGAYTDRYSGKEQFSISIKVSKNNYNSHGFDAKFRWWIIFALLFIVGIFIWVKNKK
jgi:hypothetical protein